MKDLHVKEGWMMLTGLFISCCFSVVFKGKDKSKIYILDINTQEKWTENMYITRYIINNS